MAEIMRPMTETLPFDVTATEDDERKQLKREQKLLRERARRMAVRDQCRNLWEAVDQARRMVELADHKARYALVVMGVVNAGVFLLATRSSHFAQLVPESIRAGFSFLIFPFGLVALVFLLDAYNSLRPRPPSLPPAGPGMQGAASRPLGLIFWNEILSGSVESYQRSWETVRMGQFNNELAAMAYSLAEVIRIKYTALRRLYIELLIVIILAAVILAVPMYYALVSNAPVIPAP